MIEYNSNRTLDQRSFFLQSASLLKTPQSNIPTSGHANRDMTRYIANASGPFHKHLGCGRGGIACWNPHLQSCAHLGSWKLPKSLKILKRTCKKFSQGHEVSLLICGNGIRLFCLSGQELHDLHIWQNIAIRSLSKQITEQVSCHD